MATSGIEVRRFNPSVATVWVAELLAAANRHADELENKKTLESIQQMFGKVTTSPSNPKLSFEEILCNKIAKQKKKNVEKEKQYQLTIKPKKKNVLTNGVSKTEYISEKQKAATPGNGKKMIPSVESITSRLEDQSISRSARKKLKKKLKELQSKSELTEQEATPELERKKIKLFKNKTVIGSSLQKKKLVLTNGHQPDISTALTNGHQECQANTITNGFKRTNNTIHVSTEETQSDEDDLQPPPKKSKLALKIDKLSELLKRKKKKRSKQKNIKKDNRPDDMKPLHLRMNTVNGSREINKCL